MPVVNGTAGKDFIHVSGDGLVAPLGFQGTVFQEGPNSIIRAGAGDDIVMSGLGSDFIDGGAGGDLLTGTGANGEAQGDTYADIENVNGSKGGDVIIGSAGANTLNGFEGNDRLTGGAGQDRLGGGIGTDTFIFTAIGDSVVGASADRIVDFSLVQDDRIDLSAIDASTAAVGNQTFSFIGSALYHHVAGELRFAVAGSTTTIAGDVNGDGASDFHIALTGAIALQAADFVL